MQGYTFFYWLFGIVIAFSLIVLFSYVFNRKKVKPTYNFRDEKRVFAEEIPEDKQEIFEYLVDRFKAANPLKLKKMDEKSYVLESKSIVSFLDEMATKKELFTMMDEEFYRWNWSSPLYDEFYDVLLAVSDELWQKMDKKD